MRLPGKKLTIDGGDFRLSDATDDYKCKDLKWTYNGDAYKVRIEADGKVAYIDRSSDKGIERLFGRPADMSAVERLAKMQAQEDAHQASLPPEPAPAFDSASASASNSTPISASPSGMKPSLAKSIPPSSAASTHSSSVAVVDSADPREALLKRISDLQQQIATQTKIRNQNHYHTVQTYWTPPEQKDAYWAADKEIRRITAELANAEKSLHELKD